MPREITVTVERESAAPPPIKSVTLTLDRKDATNLRHIMVCNVTWREEGEQGETARRVWNALTSVGV